MTRDNLAADYADSMAESIAEMMAALEGDVHDDECERTDDDDACDCQERAHERMHEWPLELVAERGEPYSVLLTFGGPNAYVEWSGRRGTDSATLEVWWGGDHAVRSSDAIRSFAAWWAELMEGDES